jgi:hypothetical protein
MNIIEQFAENVLNKDKSFVLENDKGYMYAFMQVKVGKAKYIYVLPPTCDETFFCDMTRKAELAAIVSKNIIYIVNEFIFGEHMEFKNTKLPWNVRAFNEAYNEAQDYVNHTYVQDYYNKLKTSGVDISYPLKQIREEARKAVLFPDNKTDNKIKCNISEYEYAQELCGYVNLKSLVLIKMDNNKEYYTYLKASEEIRNEFINNPETVKEYEKEIVNGLNSESNAKMVTVEFEYNGKRASGKITPEKVIKYMLDESGFSMWSFETRVQGDRLLNELGVSVTQGLKCEHITRITYGRKELYVRKEESKS